MDATLESLCLGCAKYQAGDHTARLLAGLCLAPYFVVYHAAAMVYARRELHKMFVLLGLLANTALGFTIKRTLRHPRPAHTCKALGICHKHGMPSSHMQLMAFAVTTCALLYWQRQRRSRASRGAAAATTIATPTKAAAQRSQRVQQAELLALGTLAAAVGYARVHLGYHTPGQVAAGATVGGAFALLWHLLTIHLARPYFEALASLSAELGLWFRDTLDYDDIHRAEFEACGAKHKPA